MPENHLFEYAAIRLVPKVEREEFLNIGVILYCRKLNFLETLITIDEKRLSAFSGCPDREELQAYLRAFEQICRGDSGGGPIAGLDIASRFRWLTATRSTILQTSAVHTGLCENADEMLTRIHAQLVL